MKQIAIRKYYSFFNIETNEIESDSFDEKMELLDADLKAVFYKHGIEMSGSETRFLPIEKLSIFKCENCNQLMVNRDRNPMKFESNGIDNSDLDWVILDGGSHEGKNLCEECLPLLHRWGHYS